MSERWKINFAQLVTDATLDGKPIAICKKDEAQQCAELIAAANRAESLARRVEELEAALQKIVQIQVTASRLAYLGTAKDIAAAALAAKGVRDV